MGEKPTVPTQVEKPVMVPGWSGTQGQNDAKAPPGSSADSDQARDELTGRK